MDPSGFLRASRVVIVAGKGGVGKTTVVAALARMAATDGMSVLAVEVDAGGGLGRLFGGPALTDEPRPLLGTQAAPGRIEGRSVTPDHALLEYLEDHGLRRLSRRLASTGALDVVATAAPGIKDILVLGKVKQLERSGQTDLVLVDAPAAGHAITFLRSARGLLDAVRLGPIHVQAQEVLDLLSDPRRCSVLLVTLAEETPVNEAVETAFSLEDRVGVSLSAVVVNAVHPPVVGLEVDPASAAAALGADLAGAALAAATFGDRRRRLQAAQIERLAQRLPLPQLLLPFLPGAGLGPAEVEALADALTAQVSGMARVGGA